MVTDDWLKRLVDQSRDICIPQASQSTPRPTVAMSANVGNLGCDGQQIAWTSGSEPITKLNHAQQQSGRMDASCQGRRSRLDGNAVHGTFGSFRSRGPGRSGDLIWF
jgi:hypothetical protein